MTTEVTPQDIHNLLELLQKIAHRRQRNHYNILFDARLVATFKSAISDLSPDYVRSQFVDFYIEFCKSIPTSDFLYRKISNEKKGVNFTESLESISETIFALDVGYGIFSKILSNYSGDEVRKIFWEAEDIFTAFDILSRKRMGLFKYFDPFSSIYVEMELFDKNFNDGYDLIERSGYSHKIPKEVYQKKIQLLQDNSKNAPTKTKIKDIVFELFEQEHIFFQLDLTASDEDLVKKIAEILPETNIELINKNYTEKDRILFTIGLYKKEIKIEIGVGDGLGAIVVLLNPIIEKEQNKSFVQLGSKHEYNFLLVDTKNKKEIKASPFLAY